MTDDATTDAVYDIAAQAARWRERAERAEARVAELEDAVRALTADEVDDATIAVAQAMLAGSPETP